jgi:hypothetical protein
MLDFHEKSLDSFYNLNYQSFLQDERMKITFPNSTELWMENDEVLSIWQVNSYNSV